MNQRITIRSRLFNLALILFLLVLSIPRVSGSAQNNVVEHLAVIQILDDSGSMRTSDPTNLRYAGTQLFVSLLDEGDAVGALRFSSTSRPITSGIEIITSHEQRNRLVERLTPEPPDGFTDVKSAFEEARRMQQAFNQSGYQVVVIFLTDGKPEIPSSYVAYEQEALDAARSLGVPILSIALTSGGQTPFLNQLARETGGQVILAKSASDLLDVYLQILGNLKDRTVMGEGVTQAPNGATLKLDPALMPYVSRVTFVVSQESGGKVKLFGPDKKEVRSTDSMVAYSMTTNPGFTTYTIANPASGNWEFNLSGKGIAQIRAILHSRLRTKIVSPTGLVEAGPPMLIVVNLIEEQLDGSAVKVVGDVSFSAIVTLPDGTRQSLDTFYDDGTHGDLIAGDGSYSREFVETSLPGTYGISVRGLKGVVPVTIVNQVAAISFPKILIDQPVKQKYEIRSNTVPLKIHLEGTTALSNFEGGFKAKVISPAGKIFELDLKSENGAYTGEFSPAESGVHVVVFQSTNAFYQGLYYQKEVRVEFETVLYSQMTIQSVHLGLENTTSPGKYELQQAIRGIPLRVTVRSNSTKSEQVIPKLEHLPGFSLAETAPIFIAPNGETTLTLHLVGDKQIEPGKWDGFLIFVPRGMVDMVNSRAPIRVEIFIPKITFSAEVVSKCSEEACWQWAPVKLILKTSSTSLVTEKIDLSMDSKDNWELSSQTIDVPPGEGEIELTLTPVNGIVPGNYQVSVLLGNSREGINILPTQSIPIAFMIEPFWVGCQRSLIFLGGGLLTAFMIIVRVILMMRGNTKPPIVTGTLVHWNKDLPNVVTNVDLTAMKKTQISIGKGGNNEVVLPDDTVDEVYVVIVAQRVEQEVRLMLQPRSKVRRGYREYSDPLSLEEDIIYQVGSRMFQYIRDANL
ncbi:MAG: choice-of-anchor X domain-containing protein [Bacteroidales bacterium]